MKPWKKFGYKQRKMLSSQEACNLFFDKYGGKERNHLNALWKSWSAIMGEDIAGLGFPLGHNKKTLLVGSDDNMALQELSMQSMEILERANVFMDSNFFETVKFVLLQGQRPLNLFRPRSSAEHPKIQLEDLPQIGALLGKLNPESPVTLCYEAYVRLAKELKEGQ